MSIQNLSCVSLSSYLRLKTVMSTHFFIDYETVCDNVHLLIRTPITIQTTIYGKFEIKRSLLSFIIQSIRYKQNTHSQFRCYFVQNVQSSACLWHLRQLTITKCKKKMLQVLLMLKY